MEAKKRKVSILKSFSLRIPSDIKELEKVEDFVSSIWREAIGSAFQSTHSQIQEFLVKLALHEALLNVMRHAYNNDPSKEIILESRIFSDKVEFRINDRGESYDYVRNAKKGFDEVPQESGYGLPLIFALMDEVKYRPRTFKGNSFKIAKKYSTEYEEALRDSEEKLRSIFESSPSAITITDLTGKIIDCNQKTLELSGYVSRQEMIGINSFTLIAQRDQKRAAENLMKTLEQGTLKSVEYTFLKKDGTEYPVELSASLIKDPSGKPVSFMAIITDITERRRAQDALQVRNKAMDTSVNAIVMIDLPGKITYVNHAFLEKWGYEKAEEVVGRAGDEFWAPKVKRSEIEKALKERGSWIGEISTIRKDNSHFFALLSISYVRNEEGKPISMLLSLLDITERKEMENAAAEIQRSLLPTSQPALKEADISWKFIPSESIGGDIFNFFMLDDEHLAVYMLDVSGHGIPSAMVSVSVSQLLTPQTGYLIKDKKVLSPAEVIRTLDQEYPLERFGKHFTICYLVINVKSGTVRYCNAASPPPLILRKSGKVEYLEKGGSFVGLGDIVPFEEGEVKLEKGDKLFIYTDGALECQNEKGEFYGREHLLVDVDKYRKMTIREMLDGLIGCLMDFCRATYLRDDITMLGIEFRK